MQEHPMRERIYLPVVRFGVPHTDWKYVFLVTLAGFVLPFIFKIKLFGVPAPMLTGMLTLAVSVAFFNFIHLGRRSLWFQHTLSSLLSSSVMRAPLPMDDLKESWLKREERGPGSALQRATTIQPLVFRDEEL